MKTTVSYLIPFLFFFQQLFSQLPSEKMLENKLSIQFNKNIELLGFVYFIAYEGTNIETKILEIDGKEVPKKEWQSYGYNFYTKYKQLAQSEHAIKAMSVAEHLWLSEFWPLLLQVEDFPYARLTPTINQNYYLCFSKSKNPEEATKNAEIFLSALNALYKEINFDKYLIESSEYYHAAISQIQKNLSSSLFLKFTESFYRKTFDQYILIPSLTLPKGMGFGPRLKINEKTIVYNIFGAVDFQNFMNTAQPNMGFGNQDKLRELSIHEFGHSFVNPEFEKLSASRIEKMATLFEPLRDDMEKQGYNNWSTCLNEHFVRAGEILIAKKMGNITSEEKLEHEYLNKRKFIYIPLIIDELKHFDTDPKDTYQQMMERVLLKLEKETANNNTGERKKIFTDNPREVLFHTEDIDLFWGLYDRHNSKLSGKTLQQEYLDKGSIGLKKFIKFRIESGRNLNKIIQKEREYYSYVRPFTLSINDRKEKLYEHFETLKKIYPKAVFPDVYFVIGANNSGGTIFEKGLIIGAERLGKANDRFSPALDIDDIYALVTHELIHFQQRYANDNSLLAQCIKEGAADFISELISGNHCNKDTYAYGDANKKELWEEFTSKMYADNWAGWLYGSKDKSRPQDLGYWMGYQICKAYYNRIENKQQAISDILNINNFKTFLEASKYNGE